MNRYKNYTRVYTNIKKSNTKTKESEEIMKNFIIVVLLVVIGWQYVNYKALQNDYINILQAIEEEII